MGLILLLVILVLLFGGGGAAAGCELEPRASHLVIMTLGVDSRWPRILSGV
jgi:hypothetical protein